MKTQEELRNGTTSNYVIFFGETELPTSKSGAINSKGGLVLTATLPTGERIEHRSNDVYGVKGFSINGVKKALVELKRPELKGMLNFKY
jgi:hypothetical protein